VVNFIHLVFRQTRELNLRPRTMAQTVSPGRSPLDQGASPFLSEIKSFLNLALFFESAVEVAKIGSSLKSNHHQLF
jgi:hypothetical protein